MILKLWHGSSRKILAFDPAKTRDKGVHLGTEAQARMRNPAVLHEVEVAVDRIRRCRDRGGDWEQRIRDARHSGFSAIVYLNRYEGLSHEVIERLHNSGRLKDLDTLSDAAFRKIVPEAEDSYILFDPERIRIVAVIEPGPCEQNMEVPSPGFG